MPERGKTTEKKRFWLGVYSKALDAVGVDAKLDDVLAWVELHEELWASVYPKLPGDSTAKSYIKQLRDHDAHHRLDTPWSMGSGYAPEHPLGIPPSALPDVLAIWRRLAIGGKRLTKREAVWIGRLSALVPPTTNSSDRWRSIYGWASTYSSYERAAGAAGEEFDSIALDAGLAFNDATSQHNGLWARTYELARKLGVFRRSPQLPLDDDAMDAHDLYARGISLPMLNMKAKQHGWPGQLTWQESLQWLAAVRWRAEQDHWDNLSEVERDEVVAELRAAIVDANWEAFDELVELR